MSKRESTPRTEQQSRFRELKDQFDRSHRGIKSQEDVAHEIVRYATEETYDCLSVLRGLNIGYQALWQGNKTGAVIVEGIEKYFQEAKINHKILLPTNQKPEEAIRESNQLLDSLAKYRSKATLRPVTVNDFIITLTRLFYRNPPGMSAFVLTAVANNDEMKTKPHYAEATSSYQELHRDLVPLQHLDINDPMRMKIPEIVIVKATGTPLYPDSGIPDLATTAHGGITLKELADFQLDATNINDFGQKVISYLLSIPKGDYFWQRLVQGAFFTHPIGDLNVDPKEFFTQPELSEKIFLFQQWLTEKLILPVFDETATDANFDKQFAGLISGIDVHAFNELATTLFMQVSHAPKIRQMFHPEGQLIDQIAYCPLSILATNETIGEGGMMEGRKTVDLFAIMHYFVRRHLPDLQRNLGVRFFGQKRIPIILEAFRAGVSIDYEEMHTEEFIEDMQKYLGINFMEKLNARQNELEQVSSEIWNEISSSPRVSYWPHPGTAPEIAFSPGSLPEIMGFRSITFTVHEEPGKPVEFMLLIRDKNISVIGHLGADGKISFLSADIKEKYPGLLNLIENISVVSFHDLIIREQIMAKKRDGQTQASTTASSEQGGGEKGKPQQKRKHRRKIPRQLIYPDAPRAEKKPVASDDIRETIDNVLKPFTPRPVDMYKRYVEGGRRYHDLVQRLNQTTTDREQLLAQLEEAREELERPSPAKLAALPNLPVSFHPVTVQDPITNVTYVLETWVIAHTSPKPTTEERISPVKMYRKYYKEGSAIGFWEYMKTWIVESETTAVIE